MSYKKPKSNSRCPLRDKRVFPTDIHAEMRAADIGKRCGLKLYIYRCDHCEGWHITKKLTFESLIRDNLNTQ